ncbi:YihY/virulence factor BrkB family protein [Cryomorphaceae bacterium 1068]|nr:YihY/virulence factor BrkB family protein [Cryomorphaceae bacterium 1068]
MSTKNSKNKEEKFKLKDSFSILKEAAIGWNNSDPFRLSAVIAYYAVLSMPALLVIIVNLLGLIWGNEVIEGRLSAQLSSVLGTDSAEAVSSMIENSRTENSSILFSIIGIGSLLFGATGVFFHLQISLNKVWNLKPNPDATWKRLVIDRVLSFGFVLVLGFLLLITFVLSAAMTAFSDKLKTIFPDIMVTLAQIADGVLSLAVVTVLFALIFKYLPHAKIRWRSVWVGAILTSILFIAAEYALGFYFSQVEPGSTYGSAGSIILILLWVSYASLILFFGAEVTYVFAKRYSKGVQPTEAAVKEKAAQKAA